MRNVQAAFLLLLLVALAATAQAAALSSERIKAFLDVLEESDELIPDEEYTEADDQGLVTPEEWTAFLDRHAAVRDLAASKGFSPSEFGRTASRVMRAYIALSVREELAVAEPELLSTSEEIRKDPSLTEEQKAEFLDSINQSLAAMREMADAPAEDVAAVEPFVERLDAMSGESEPESEPGAEADPQGRTGEAGARPQ